MAVELELDHVVPRIDVRDGQRVVILDDGHAEVILRLPARDPWRPLIRLSAAADRFRDEIRVAGYSDVPHTGVRAAPPGWT